MRYLVLADIHGNLHGLQAALDAARTEGFDRALVLGDIVGYGAYPNEVITALQALPGLTIIRGNHDKVVAGLGDSDDFNPVARDGAHWSARMLTEDHAAWLRGLPPGPAAVSDWIEICHGTPYNEDEYVLDPADAAHALRAASRPLCLFGHTHAAMAFRLTAGRLEWVEPGPDGRLPIRPEATYLANVGSAGQPRDGDPRAAFGIADDEARELRFFRVAYDIPAAQAAIRAAHLPEALATRLALGR